ncbi:MAG: hypothetical protein CL678_05150 [Bdellovibrionaceae bacterium]|nr:hypothetical protein [Pseudobdellovibrionaceae bacterium]|tara:strand:+ start:3761 stop:4312 length:552 start_codon:yes stop_codon:yes gene_type:complete
MLRILFFLFFLPVAFGESLPKDPDLDPVDSSIGFGIGTFFPTDGETRLHGFGEFNYQFLEQVSMGAVLFYSRPEIQSQGFTGKESWLGGMIQSSYHFSPQLRVGARLGLLQSSFDVSGAKVSYSSVMYGPLVVYDYFFSQNLSLGADFSFFFISRADTDLSSGTGSRPSFRITSLGLSFKYWF